MRHQELTVKFCDTHDQVFDMSDPGTGKTAAHAVSFARKRRKGAGCMLVFAPRTLLRTAWANDFAKFVPDMKVSVATAANRAEAFAAEADAYITNVDAATWVAQQKAPFFRRFEGGLLLCDESTAFKNPTSQRSKAVAKITKHFRMRRVLTATPTSRSITDIWHQAYIVDGGKRLGNSFYAFRNTVCVPEQVGRNANALNWVDREGAEEAVFDLLSDITIRHRREDCLDIPPTHYHTIEYDMPARQRKAYVEMEEKQIALLTVDRVKSAFLKAAGKSKLDRTAAVTAVNAAAVAQKLLQIASGAVYETETKYHVVDDSRYELILDLAEARKHPLVLFFWKHQRDLLTQHAQRRKLRFAVLDGDTKDAARNQIVTAYQAGAYDLILGHPKTVAHGLTLTRGTSTIWPGPTYDLEWWKQGNLRQARIGQTEHTEVLTVMAQNTIEQKVYDLMTGKDRRMSNLLQLFALYTQDLAGTFK